MKSKFFKTLMTATLAVTLLTGCEKSKTPVPYNPLNGRTTAVFNPNKKYGSVSDVDGNVYKTIVIGTQTWMAENLRVTHYQNGDSIPEVADNNRWRSMISGAFCNYNNTTDLDTIATFGRLYNWYAVADSRNIAPKGWHVPTAPDWLTLINYLGGDNLAGNKMKEVGNAHWLANASGSDNSSGFTALPTGQRDQLSGGFDPRAPRVYSVWWTASESNDSAAAFLYLDYAESYVWKGFNFKVNGYSVRCVKDNSN